MACSSYSTQAAQLQEQEDIHAQINNNHNAAREEAMVLEAVRLSTQDEAARRGEAEVVEAVRRSSQDDALRRAREDNERAQLDMVIAETQEDAELARALAQSRTMERDRQEADELARALRLSRAAERERKERADLEAALALSLAEGGEAPPAPSPRRPGLRFLAELDAAVDGRVQRPLLETRVERPQQSLDAALTSPSPPAAATRDAPRGGWAATAHAAAHPPRTKLCRWAAPPRPRGAHGRVPRLSGSFQVNKCRFPPLAL